MRREVVNLFLKSYEVMHHYTLSWSQKKDYNFYHILVVEEENIIIRRRIIYSRDDYLDCQKHFSTPVQ